MRQDVAALVERPEVTHAVREFEVPPEELDRSADGWAAAGAVVWNPRGEAAFVENAWSDGWVLPGGGVEDDESFAAAARREIREETGLDPEFLGPRRVEEQVFRAAGGAASGAGDGADAGDGPEAGDGADAREVRGFFAVFAARTDETAFGRDLGEHDDEIQRVGWFAEPPADTATMVDADALLRDCRVERSQ